jgi:hypothetical protein
MTGDSCKRPGFVSLWRNLAKNVAAKMITIKINPKRIVFIAPLSHRASKAPENLHEKFISLWLGAVVKEPSLPPLPRLASWKAGNHEATPDQVSKLSSSMARGV